MCSTYCVLYIHMYVWLPRAARLKDSQSVFFSLRGLKLCYSACLFGHFRSFLDIFFLSFYTLAPFPTGFQKKGGFLRLRKAGTYFATRTSVRERNENERLQGKLGGHPVGRANFTEQGTVLCIRLNVPRRVDVVLYTHPLCYNILGAGI